MVNDAFEDGRPVWEQVVCAEALQRRTLHSGNCQLVSDHRDVGARRLYSLLMMPNTRAVLVKNAFSFPTGESEKAEAKLVPLQTRLLPTILTRVLKRFLTATTWPSRLKAPSVGGYLNSTAPGSRWNSPRVMNYSCSGQRNARGALAAGVIMSCCCRAP